MGRGILIVVLGLSIIITILIMNLNANTDRGLESTINYFDKTQARLIADSGIETYLEKLRRNKTLGNGEYNNNSMMGGHYDIEITGVDTSMTIKSVGEFDGVKHTCIVTAKREKITMPIINSALYISAPTTGLDLNGNMFIDGNDHNVDGSPGPSPPLSGITVDSPTDSAYIINNIKSKIDNAIDGQGGAPSVSASPSPNDWLKLTQSYIFAADTTLASGTYNTGTLGTMAEPKITYAKGNIKLTGGLTGAGIMIIDGDVDMEGKFNYNGIIIVYGQSTVVTKTTGDAGVYGATIAVGTTVDMTVAGTAQFYYSSQAIENARANLKSSRFHITSWYE